MKTKGNIQKYLSLFLAAMSIVTAISFLSPIRAEQKSGSKIDLANEQDEPVQYLQSYSLEAVIPFASIDLQPQVTVTIPSTVLYFIISEEVTPKVPIYISKYLKTLFLFIISPNAP